MNDFSNYHRRTSSEVMVGHTPMGASHPIRIQSMATVSTNDTEGCVAQARRIIDTGGEYVRFTTQGVREAENTRNIRDNLRAAGYTTPLVADVHFNPHVAEVAALYCEKVRINPGNYTDPARTFKKIEYTDKEYALELKKIEQTLLPLLQICREHHTAIRIGVNHGSLSDRIMSRYGDTPEGIVESCMEFLRICQREKFPNVVISIKASNTVVMVQSVRQLVKAMDREDMHYPLHLGVTEAGEGEDGRIKSAVGIGALLTEGIGDTIRVSLSEEPECEIPVARKIVDSIEQCRRLQDMAESRQDVAQWVRSGEEYAYIKEDDTLCIHLNTKNLEDFQIHAAMTASRFLIDRRCTKLILSEGKTSSLFPTEKHVEVADAILQAARIKFTKTEYISCPGCGRTLYDLQGTIARIKEATKHMKGLKIGIMGCIVNGPGEMADADYGYVGAGRGKISLYRRKVCVEKNIPEEEAVEHLLQLIAKG